MKRKPTPKNKIGKLTIEMNHWAGTENPKTLLDIKKGKIRISKKGRTMNLYLISQNENNNYDTYDSAVVAAPDEKTARWMHPGHGGQCTDEEWKAKYSSWCHSPKAVMVEFIGEAVEGTDQGVVCASFNAG